jgi:hypothetical protein
MRAPTDHVLPSKVCNLFHLNDGIGVIYRLIEIGDKLGPFDLAMIPIWRGGTLQFIAWLGLKVCLPSFAAFIPTTLKLTTHALTASRHCTPAEALSIHTDIRSRHSLAMHFATLAGSDIEAFEPIVELTAERQKRGIRGWEEEGGFGVVDVGETVTIPLELEEDAEVYRREGEGGTKDQDGEDWHQVTHEESKTRP